MIGKFATLVGISILGLGIAQSAPFIDVDESQIVGIFPGSEFSIVLSIGVDPGSSLVAYDFFVKSDVNATFSLMSQELKSPVNEANFSGAYPFFVSTTSNADFGAFSMTDGFGPGVHQAQTLTFKVDPSVITGTYHLMFSWNQPDIAGPSLVYELNGDLFEFQMASPISVEVIVVPEPAPIALAALAGIVGSFSRRRSMWRIVQGNGMVVAG